MVPFDIHEFCIHLSISHPRRLIKNTVCTMYSTRPVEVWRRIGKTKISLRMRSLSPFTHNGPFPHVACHLFVYVLLFSGPAVIYKTSSMEGWCS